ncbi:MAG: hypothetical protein FWG87_07760 [Defluviitaleaceae bacterium]|nr:hypothetical protein [Defluviitaleaceae bacterium]
MKVWSANLADFKGMERGFSRIWRIFADFFLRLLETDGTQVAWIFN